MAKYSKRVCHAWPCETIVEHWRPFCTKHWDALPAHLKTAIREMGEKKNYLRKSYFVKEAMLLLRDAPKEKAKSLPFSDN